MDFDDRLRDHLHEQGHNLSIRPEGVDAVAHRSRVRRQRKNAGAIAAALVIVAGLAGWTLTTMDSEPAEVATEGLEAEDTADEATEGQATTPAEADAEQPPEDPVAGLPEAGAALSFSAIDNDDAPGGFNVYQNGSTADLYYVLSTAPGVTYDSFGDEFIRNDTLYTFDGDDWSRSTFDDRFVSTIGSSANGVLYTVSTGTSGEQSLEVGSSTDGGDTWNWVAVDLTDQFGADPALWPAFNARVVGHDPGLVVVNKAAGPDYEQAIELARGVGLDIDLETSIVFDVTTEGLRWAPGWDSEASPCQAEFSAFIDERFAELEQQAEAAGEIDETFYFEFESRYAEIEAEALAMLATLDGCDVFVECQTELTSRNTDIGDEERRIVSEMGLDPDTDYWEGLSDEQMQELSVALEELGADSSRWLDESGCGEILFGPGFTFDESDAEFVTWESLGVTPPASWSGSTRAYLVDDSSVTELGAVFGDVGFLVSLTETDAGFEATFDNTSYETFAEEVETNDLVTWSSPDGRSWTSTPADVSVFAYDEGEVDGSTFALAWDEVDASIQRTDPDGAVVSYRLEDLAADVEISSHTITGLATGPYGVVAWAVDWEGGGDTIVLYSPDGSSWGATPLGIEVVDMIVGTEGVMAFMQDRAIVGTGDPQPILFGTV